jgi:hypothetical protein
MAKDILKEAIADAKAVREVALANAKAALEEAFTPKLQSMLSAKLSETLNEEEDELEENKEETVSEITGMDEEEDTMDENENLDEEIDLEEILSELELEEGEDSKEETVDEVKAEDDELEEVQRVGQPNYKGDETHDVLNKASDAHQGLKEDKAFDLDALLEEINNLDETEEVDESWSDPKRRVNDDNPDKWKSGNSDFDESWSDPKRRVNDDNPDKWKSGNSDFDEGETNEVLGAAAAGVAGLVAAAGGLSHIEMAAEDPEFAAKYPKVARALKTLQGMGKAAADTKRMEETAKDEELAETKAALETVRTELNEVNLLNSKLLYVNRIFKANNLNDSQKLRVVESLDKADCIKEAKLIYETIKDTFNVANASKRSFQNKTKSLKEGIGMASKATGTSTAPIKEVITESDNMVNRFQKLANIKINQ